MVYAAFLADAGSTPDTEVRDGRGRWDVDGHLRTEGSRRRRRTPRGLDPRVGADRPSSLAPAGPGPGVE